MRQQNEKTPSALGRPRSLLRTVGSISSATMASRVLGLGREMTQSYMFGAGPVTDAFLAAFRIPNLLRDLFAEGALSAAFVPTFIGIRERDGTEAAWQLARRVMTALAVLLGVLTLVIAVGAPWILRIYVGGFEPEKLALTATMTRILSPFLLFIALAAVAMGILNACGRFFVPAFASAWFNVAAILGMVFLTPLFRRAGIDESLSLAYGALIGGMLQFAVQWPSLRAEGFRYRPMFDFGDPGLRRMLRLMAPATAGLAATQVNILVDTVLASHYGDGPITWLQYAFRLLQLPIGLFGVAIATANLARVSADAARGDNDGLKANLAAALRTAALLALPATVGLIVLRREIVAALFERGAFTAGDTARTSAALMCYALGLYAYAVTKIQVPTFYALGETSTPVRASVGSVLTKIAANFAFLALLPKLGIDAFLGLALSTSVGAWINFAWLAGGLRKRIGGLSGQGVVAATLKMLALSLLMGLVVEGTQRVLGLILYDGTIERLLRLGLAILSGVLVVALVVPHLGLPETRGLYQRLRRSR